MAMTTRTLVCLDKDGTLLDDVPYNVDPDLMRFAPGSAEAVALLARAGYQIAVVSNQSGVSRRWFAESALADVERRLVEMCEEAGGRLDAFYYCPHDEIDACGCRKPAAGMIDRALRDAGAEPASSWMVGDILDDVEAGRRAGCRTILVDNGNETVWRRSASREPHHVASDMAEAARIIVGGGAAS